MNKTKFDPELHSSLEAGGMREDIKLSGSCRRMYTGTICILLGGNTLMVYCISEGENIDELRMHATTLKLRRG